MPEDVQTGTPDAQADNGPVTVQYPSGHTVQFPTEAHANEHAASVWDQLKSGWNTVKNWQGVEGPDGADRQVDSFGQSILDKVKQWHKTASDTLEEAGAELGRKPAELLSGAKNFQAMLPSPYGQKPLMESMEDTAKREHPVLSGAGEGAGRFTGGMLAPVNVAIMATMPAVKAVPLLSKALTVAFAADMSTGAIRDAKNIVSNWAKMTPQQRTSALTSGALQTVLAGLTTIHAFGGDKVTVPAELKGESGEMTIPGTGDTVGSAAAAAKDTQYFNEAKAENPEGSFSDWARIAQEKKAKASAIPTRTLTAADKAAAAGASDVNEKGQKLGIKPIEGLGQAPVVDKTGHPDYNDKGQMLGVPPDVEDIGGKVRNENQVIPASSANNGLLNRLWADEEGSLRIPFTGNTDQGDLFPGGEPKVPEAEERTPIWYSHAIDTISDKVQDNMSGDQVRGILVNNGVTPDEMHAGGLDDYLSGKGKVSKAALQQHMQEHQIQLSDMNYGAIEANPELSKQAALHEKLGTKLEEQERAIFRDVDNGHSTRHADSFLDEPEDKQKAALDSMSPDARQNMFRYLNTLQARLDTAQEMTGLEMRLNPEETEKANGRPTYDLVDTKNGRVRYTSGARGIDAYLNEEIQGDSSSKYTNASAKYPQWVIGKQWDNQGGLGAKDYTEKLMTLPPGNRLTDAYAKSKKAYGDFESEMQKKYADKDGYWSENMSPDEKLQHTTLEAQSIAARDAAQGQVHKHSHWSDANAKNVVAFARYGSLPQFTDKPTMMLHEMQSDWNTDIKHSGYQGEREELDNRIKELTDKKASIGTDSYGATLREKGELTKLQDKVESFKARLKEGEELNPAEKDSFREAQKRAKEILGKNVGPSFSEQDQKDLDSANVRRQYLNENAEKANVKPPQPNAPLVNNWHEVAAKRMLREMVDHGYKRMVWPTGEAAADLYGVHSHIKEIRWNPNTGQIDLVQHDGQVRPQSIEPTKEGLMKGLELPEEQATKLANSVADYKAADKPHNEPEPEEDEDDERPTEEEYRNMMYDRAAEDYSVSQTQGDPMYEIWHDDQFIEGDHETMREAKKAMREWWEENYPEHDIDTGEYNGELEEDDENHPGNMEAPEIRENEGETRYELTDSNGDTIDTFDSEREADRARDRAIDSDVDDSMNNAGEDDYKPDTPVKVKPKVPESEYPKLQGMDLHFGGKLHKLLYNEMLPRFMTKYLKKWGASVSKIDVPGAAPPSYKYQGPDVSIDELKDLKYRSGDVTSEVSSAVQEMRNRIVERMENEHKTFSQAVDETQESPHFDRAYEQQTQRTSRQELSNYEKEALNQLVEHFNGKIEKTPGTRKFWQIESTPQMERALKTKPQRISQMAAPKLGPQVQEQTA